MLEADKAGETSGMGGLSTQDTQCLIHKKHKNSKVSIKNFALLIVLV